MIERIKSKIRLSNFFLFWVTVFFIFACSSKHEKREKFKQIINDLVVAEHVLSAGEKPIVSLDTLYQYSYKQVLKKHGVSAEEFSAMIEYYTLRPLEFEKILTELRETYKKEEEEYKRPIR